MLTREGWFSLAGRRGGRVKPLKEKDHVELPRG